MWPREHGAYGQLVFPLLTVGVVAGLSVPALLIVAVVVSGFLAHEPLLVLIGRRGARVRRESGRLAAMWLGGVVAAGLLAAGAALRSLPPETRWTLVIPAVPALALALFIARRQEKSTSGEVCAASAFAGAAVPVGVAAGMRWVEAAGVAAVFVLMFVLQTLTVRGIVLEVRGGGNQRAARHLRWAALALGVAGAVGLAALARGERLPWIAPFAAAPGLATTVWLTLFPPPPTRLRTVGWTLVTASVVTAAILMAGL